jgi:hypothetical protein
MGLLLRIMLSSNTYGACVQTHLGLKLGLDVRMRGEKVGGPGKYGSGGLMAGDEHRHEVIPQLLAGYVITCTTQSNFLMLILYPWLYLLLWLRPRLTSSSHTRKKATLSSINSRGSYLPKDE